MTTVEWTMTGNKGLDAHLPDPVRGLKQPQTDLPRIAKDAALVALIERAVRGIPTHHQLRLQDSRKRWLVEPDSVHLVLTSPPY